MSSGPNTLQREKVIDYFDTSALDYDRAISASSVPKTIREFLFYQRKQIVLSLLRGKSGTAIDVGCGPAVFARELSGQGLRFIGIDPSVQMIRLAQEKCPDIPAKFLVQEARNIGFAQKTFDLVVCTGVLEYLDDPLPALTEIARIGKDHHAIVISFPNLLSPFNIVDRMLSSIFRLIKGSATQNQKHRMLISGSIKSHNYSAWAMRRNLEKLGYNKFIITYHGFRFAWIKQWAAPLVIWLNQRGFLRLPLISWCGINCIIYAEK